MGYVAVILDEENEIRGVLNIKEYNETPKESIIKEILIDQYCTDIVEVTSIEYKSYDTSHTIKAKISMDGLEPMEYIFRYLTSTIY